jgi:2-hydroxy-6-oxonona-2,4-dienedioate hydrolase
VTSETATVDADSIAPQYTSDRIAYRRFGAGEPVALLHGGSGSWSHWRRNIPALALRRQVIVPDLPGYGESNDVAADISVDGYANVVARALQQMIGPSTRFDLVGFSFGGLIAAGVAAQLGAQVRRLCLLAPSGFAKATGRVLGRRPRHTFPAGDDGMRDFLRHHLLAMMLANPVSVDTTTLDVHRANLANARFDNRHLSWCDRVVGFLSELQCPVRLIYGAEDKTAFPSIDARVALARAAVPSLELHIVPGAGHWVQYERSRETTLLILQFLDANPGAPPSPVN